MLSIIKRAQHEQHGNSKRETCELARRHRPHAEQHDRGCNSDTAAKRRGKGMPFTAARVVNVANLVAQRPQYENRDSAQDECNQTEYQIKYHLIIAVRPSE